MCVAPFRSAWVRASARTSRPSASVLTTSTVLPSALTTMSPGRCAVGPGMFSAAATIAITSSGTLREAMTSIADKTAAAPDMSPFMRLMCSGSFSEMPPVSNVIPLPINASTVSLELPEAPLPARPAGRAEPASPASGEGET